MIERRGFLGSIFALPFIKARPLPQNQFGTLLRSPGRVFSTFLPQVFTKYIPNSIINKNADVFQCIIVLDPSGIHMEKSL